MTDQDWLASLPAMSVDQLDEARAMLESQRRHPATRMNARVLFAIGERIADIEKELYRRFSAIVAS